MDCSRGMKRRSNSFFGANAHLPGEKAGQRTGFRALQISWVMVAQPDGSAHDVVEFASERSCPWN